MLQALCSMHWGYSGEQNTLCPHGAYNVAGETDNKQTYLMYQFRVTDKCNKDEAEG